MRLALPLLLFSCAPQIPDDLDSDSFLKLFSRAMCRASTSCGSVVCDTQVADVAGCAFREDAARSCLEAFEEPTCDGARAISPDVCNRAYDCGETVPGPSNTLVPAVVILSGAFVYDADREAAIEGVNNGSAVPPEVAIIVGEEDWTGDLDDLERYCISILRGLAPSESASWASSVAGSVFAMDVREPGVTATSCDDALEGGLPTAEEMAAIDWQMGVLGDVDDGYWTRLVSGGAVDPDDRNQYLGGFFAGDVGSRMNPTTGRLRDVLVTGFATDDGVLRVDGSGLVPMDRADMMQGGELQSGFYTLQLILSPDVLDVLR